MADLDRFQRELDTSGTMEATDVFQQKAVDILLGKKALEAFDISLEPEKSANVMETTYGVNRRRLPGVWSRPV